MTHKKTPTISTSRGLLLGTILIFHTGLVFRFRIVRLFPADWIGYAAIGCIFFALAVLLLYGVRFFDKSTGWPLPSFVSSGPAKLALTVTAVFVVLVGLIWRYQVYSGTQINSRMGDMLPLIDLATSTFLSGEFPYRVYELPWKVPLTYMPGLWTAYLPGQLFDADLRSSGLLFSGAAVLLMLFAGFRDMENTEVLIAGWFIIAGFCLSPAIARFSINGHTYPLWFYTAAFGFSMVRGHCKTAAICFGLMLAARQTSVVYLPFFMVFLWRGEGWRTLITGLLLLGVVCGFLCLPFAIIDIKAFLIDPMVAYKNMAYWDFQQGEQSFASKTIGFAYGLKTLGWMSDLSWLRYGLLAALPFLAWFCVKDTYSLLISMGAAGILFAVMAPVSWYYIYVPPILLFSFAALSKIEPELKGHCL